MIRVSLGNDQVGQPHGLLLLVEKTKKREKYEKKEQKEKKTLIIAPYLKGFLQKGMDAHLRPVRNVLNQE